MFCQFPLLAWAARQLQSSPIAIGILRKYFTKPFSQPDAPEMGRLKIWHLIPIIIRYTMTRTHGVGERVGGVVTIVLLAVVVIGAGPVNPDAAHDVPGEDDAARQQDDDDDEAHALGHALLVPFHRDRQ